MNEKNPFFGYVGNKKHTEKKLLRDVFKKGDVYFNTGDLMVQDHENFLYFSDRIGDTFRYETSAVTLPVLIMNCALNRTLGKHHRPHALYLQGILNHVSLFKNLSAICF